MNLSQLSKTVRRPKKRLGRGHGSGKVKTSGRGTKGQKARGKVRRGFEGGQLPLIKRLPLLRGKTRNRGRAAYVQPLSVEKLNNLPEKSEVTIELLRKNNLVRGDAARVKILGDGKVSHIYTVKVSCSQSAKSAIEKAGGTVQ